MEIQEKQKCSGHIRQGAFWLPCVALVSRPLLHSPALWYATRTGQNNRRASPQPPSLRESAPLSRLTRVQPACAAVVRPVPLDPCPTGVRYRPSSPALCVGRADFVPGGQVVVLAGASRRHRAGAGAVSHAPPQDHHQERAGARSRPPLTPT